MVLLVADQESNLGGLQVKFLSYYKSFYLFFLLDLQHVLYLATWASEDFFQVWQQWRNFVLPTDN